MYHLFALFQAKCLVVATCHHPHNCQGDQTTHHRQQSDHIIALRQIKKAIVAPLCTKLGSFIQN
jgi:hypothetical protein